MNNSVQVEPPAEITVKPRRKWSVVSIVGFGLSLVAFSIYFALTLNIFLTDDFFSAMMGAFFSYVFTLPIVVVAMIISVTGLILAVKCVRGKGFAIAGIVMCAPCLVWGLLWTCGALF